MTSGAGRYAPSPSGELHFGNLRTAALAWLFARSTGRRFVMRIEDIDRERSSEKAAEQQLRDLAAIGIDWDGEVVRQSDRFVRYQEVLELLDDRGLTYECYCSRKEIQEASRAPHAVPGSYPGTCRDLSDAEREARRAALEEAGRVPSVRLRSSVPSCVVEDFFVGAYEGDVDDFVLVRGGNKAQAGDCAYNFVVVVDDHDMGVDQVVRGDDLLSSAPRQAYLAEVLGFAVPEYIHVPLVVGPTGKRLAKRDGAVTLSQMAADVGVDGVVRQLCASVGYPELESLGEVLPGFDPARIPSGVWEF